MPPEIQTELHKWLRKELPATTAELQSRLDLLHRVMPQAYAAWPKNAMQSLGELEAAGLIELDLNQWRWRAVKPKTEAMLF